MKKIITLFLLLSLSASQVQHIPTTDTRSLYKRFLQEHPFNNRARLNPQELRQIPKQDRPDLAWEQNYLATLDPALGRPAPERLLAVYQQVAAQRNAPLAPGSASAPWQERGPNNVGGRTRALMWDPNAASGNKVWAGGVTGGLWYNNDITSSSSTWVAVDDFWDNISITAIAHDPNNTQIFYVATGEGWGAGAARGEGIWKSTDGGTTWNQLASTSNFYYVNDLVVRNESGTSVVYAACRGNFYRGSWHGSATDGLQRSVNGGSSWTQVLPNVPGESIAFAAADIEIAADNRLWVGTTSSSYGATDRGGGRVLYSDNGTSWTISRTVSGSERVELACAPSNSNYVYAITESSNQVDEIAKTTNKGTSWTTVNEPADADNGIPNTDFSRGQAWYDLIIAVDPNDPNTVLTGGIDLFRTTDGGTNWTQISKWSNNNNLSGLSCALVHADQHQIAFKPGNSSTAIFGNDGGVYYTNSLSNAGTSSAINARNNGYNVTQFYAAAMHPTSNQNYYLAGAQDNGTQQFNSAGVNATLEATGGDGAWCFIDQTNPNYQATSYVYNSYWRSTNAGASWGSRIQNDQSTGKFINPADYDDIQDALYSARTSSTINRITNFGGAYTIDNFTVTGMNSMAAHLRVSPYTTTSTTLFVGTDGGDLFKITNAEGGSPTATNIGSSSFPNGSISCVEIGASENELLVTFSNYGVTSVWYTSNGGTSWSSKEGNLPDMPVRWALFNPTDYNEVILATEVGVWSTSAFNAASPSWSASNSGLANVRVDMLQIRDSDKQVIAATHGRGLFSSDAFGATQTPGAAFTLSASTACVNQTITLNDMSSGSPTSWAWVITPNTFSYVNGTSATSQNPQVQFTATGTYNISLTATNINGSDQSTQANAVSVGGQTLPFSEDFEGTPSFTIDNPDNGIGWVKSTIGGTLPGNQAMGIDLVSYSTTGERDALISPALNFSGYSSISLSFEYAYRRYDASYRDSMAVYISTDCGATYTRVASYKSDPTNNFATGPDQTAAFTPAVTADWCGNTTIPNCPDIDLSAFAGQTAVRIKIESINGYGNNLWIDNVNVTGISGAAPLADFSANNTSICAGDTVNFTDLSTNTPTSWSWSISPNTFSYVNGTSAGSQNPQVQFTASGSYQISLISTNGIGTDTETKAAFIAVIANQTPAVSIAASATNICAGASVSFTATPTHGGTTPAYQWKVNGSNAGTNSPAFSSSSLSNGDVVTVELTSDLNCVTSATATSNPIAITTTQNVTPTLNVSASATSICLGNSVTFTATPTNAGATPAYQWKVNGGNVGTNSAVFTTSGLQNNDVVTVELTSSLTCASPQTVSSTGITITASPLLTPGAAISTPNSTFCAGTNVTFTANINNGGSSPVYQWTVNGAPVGTNSNTFSSSTLSNGDVVRMDLTSNASCLSQSTVSSNSIAVTVNPTVVPTVTITAGSTTICAGEPLSFTASAVNGGSSPVYQWKLNGANVGSNSPTYSTLGLNNGDVVGLTLTSNANCATPTTVNATPITITVVPMPIAAFSISTPIADLCKEDTLQLSATPAGGTFSGTGVTGNLFAPIVVGSGSHDVYYEYTNSTGCYDADTLTLSVDIVPKPIISQNVNVLTCAQGGYNYIWLLNGTPAPGANNAQTYTLTTNGIYSVRMGSGTCFDDSDPLTIMDFSLETFKALYHFSAYPNPVKDILSLHFDNPNGAEVQIELYSFNGSRVFHKKIRTTAQVEEQLSTAHLAHGMYTLKVRCGDVLFVEKVEKL